LVIGGAAFFVGGAEGLPGASQVQRLETVVQQEHNAFWRDRGRIWRTLAGASAYAGVSILRRSIVMHVNILLFEGLTQLDMTGPYEVLAAAPGFTVDFVAKTLAPVRSDRGLRFVPTQTLDSAPPADRTAGRARMMPSLIRTG